MKRSYEKPTVGSEPVFDLTSQGCDVNQQCPGECQTLLLYEPGICPLPWKVQTSLCGIMQNPREKS